MITHRWVDHKTGAAMVIIACGCCQHEYVVEVGGMAFCPSCINGNHRECKMADILGIKK